MRIDEESWHQPQRVAETEHSQQLHRASRVSAQPRRRSRAVGTAEALRGVGAQEHVGGHQAAEESEAHAPPTPHHARRCGGNAAQAGSDAISVGSGAQQKGGEPAKRAHHERHENHQRGGHAADQRNQRRSCKPVVLRGTQTRRGRQCVWRVR